MKRTVVMAVVVGLVASLSLAQVTSVNAVGIVKRNVEAQKLTFGAFNFDPVNADETAGVPLAEVLGDQLTAGNTFLRADNVIIWDIANQRYITFFKFMDGNWRNSENFGQTATNIMYNGDAFWIVSHQGADQEITFSGEVVDIPGKTNEMTFAVGLNMFGYPYPAELPLNDTGLYDAANKGTTFLTGDNVIVWDQANQQYVTYFAFLGTADWRNKDNMGQSGDFPLGLGTGYWYVRRNTIGTWAETQPYVL
ncbi:hypothetical protein ACFLSJ_05500 [Verrucomicrobiota bacterium]